MSALISFYLGEAPDAEGRMWEDVMKFNHAQLEYVHDYIQWLFPSDEPSNFNTDAPLLSEEDQHAFHNNQILRDRLLQAFRKILDFYGFELHEKLHGEIPWIYVVRSGDWDGAHQWVEVYNHNYLRITRILKCLRLCDQRHYALAFYYALDELYKEYGKRIGQRTFDFWTQAVWGDNPATA